MRIVWFSWKDKHHPQAGGAEKVSSELMARLVRDGHDVHLITARYPGSKAEAVNEDGVKVLRAGNRYTVYLHARNLYKSIERKAAVDLAVDEMNTIPFFAARYSKAEKKVLLAWQLAREVWFYQIPFPLSWVGYALEPLYLRHLSRHYKLVITESESTKTDLAKYGFSKGSVRVFRVGMELPPLKELVEKPVSNLVLFLGNLRPMKRPLDAIKAFEVAHAINPKLSMKIAGDDRGSYAQRLKRYVSKSSHKNAISFLGKVTYEQKIKLTQKADVQLVNSVKEGWGLIATEANSQGTPVIGYNVDGLRDSIQHNRTGLLVPSGDWEQMGRLAADIRKDTGTYKALRTNGWQFSKEFTFENSYKEFCGVVDIKS